MAAINQDWNPWGFNTQAFPKHAFSLKLAPFTCCCRGSAPFFLSYAYHTHWISLPGFGSHRARPPVGTTIPADEKPRDFPSVLFHTGVDTSA